MSFKKRGITLKQFNDDDPGLRTLADAALPSADDNESDDPEMLSAQEIVWDILDELEDTLNLLPKRKLRKPTQKDLFVEMPD